MSTPTRTPSRSVMKNNNNEEEVVASTPLADLTEDKERERSRLLLAQFYGAMADEEDQGDEGTPSRPVVNNSQVFDTTDIGRF